MNFTKSSHQLASLNKNDHHLSSTYSMPGGFTHLALKVKLCLSNLMPILEIKDTNLCKGRWPVNAREGLKTTFANFM